MAGNADTGYQSRPQGIERMAANAVEQLKRVEPFSADTMALGAALLNARDFPTSCYFGLLSGLNEKRVPTTAQDVFLFEQREEIWMVVHAKKNKTTIVLWDGFSKHNLGGELDDDHARRFHARRAELPAALQADQWFQGKTAFHDMSLFSTSAASMTGCLALTWAWFMAKGWRVRLNNMEASYPGMGHVWFPTAGRQGGGWVADDHSDMVWSDVLMEEFKGVRDGDHVLDANHF